MEVKNMKTKNQIILENETSRTNANTPAVGKPITPAGQDQITYNIYVEILDNVEYATDNPEILNDTAELLEELIIPETIPAVKITYEMLNNMEYIEELFAEIYTTEELEGLTETAITPEAFKYKCLKLLKDYIEYETGTENLYLKAGALEIINPEATRRAIDYYITNDNKKNITESINEALYYLDEIQNTEDELRQFIYINSYYQEE